MRRSKVQKEPRKLTPKCTHASEEEEAQTYEVMKINKELEKFRKSYNDLENQKRMYMTR